MDPRIPLPGTGKTTIARQLAHEIGAVNLRIDSIEAPIRQLGRVDDIGYRVAYAVAEDNLRLGLHVVADCVNPLQLTRRAWFEVAQHAGVTAFPIEIKCSDRDEHRRRVDKRADIRWSEVESREYETWEDAHLVVDSSKSSVGDSVRTIRDSAGV
jgi:predicted kinase